MAPEGIEQRMNKVAIIDDHPVVRMGLKAMLEKQPEFQVCGEAGSLNAAMNQVEDQNPQLAILDLTLRDGDGLELIKQLRTQNPSMPIMVFTMRQETLFAERGIRAGARAYVMKTEPEEYILKAVRGVLMGVLFLMRRWPPGFKILADDQPGQMPWAA
jgi:DNA-binding NarL/FixJ family response regulator